MKKKKFSHVTDLCAVFFSGLLKGTSAFQRSEVQLQAMVNTGNKRTSHKFQQEGNICSQRD